MVKLVSQKESERHFALSVVCVGQRRRWRRRSGGASSAILAAAKPATTTVAVHERRERQWPAESGQQPQQLKSVCGQSEEEKDKSERWLKVCECRAKQFI